MNELKNLISPAADSFDRSEENKVFLYPGHLKVSSISSKICIVSTSFQGSLVIKSVWFIILVKGDTVQKQEVQEIGILCVIQTASTMDFFHSFTVHRKYILKETVFYNSKKKKSCNSYIGFLSQL